jgi:type IV pilus assembly protein PilQ
MRTRTLLLAMLSSSPLWAQEAPSTAPSSAVTTPAVAPAAPAPAPDAVTVVAPAPATSVTKSKDTLSVDFPDEEIRTILRNVADLFELNLVVPDTLQGRTSLKLRDVTWRQIFQVVLSPAGYTFVEDGNIIKVVSQDSLAAEPVSTEIFIINYAKADDIKTTITSLVDPAAGGKLIVDQRSNALVITERPSRMGRIRPIIDQLDKATAQVMIESKFIQVNNSDTENLGVDWSSLGKVGATLGFEGKGTTSPASPIDSFREVLKNQVPYTSTFTSTNFSLFLNALQTKTKSKIVSNPTVVTLNNTEATINIGTQYPLPDYTYNAQTGTFAISGFTFKDIGVNLKVTPQVNAQGFIRLSLEPEISSLGDVVSLGAGAGGANIPQILTKRVKTSVSLADGNTLGIGGLISTSKGTTKTQVPFLGSIPLLGRLFSTDAPNDTNSNLLIFITAKAISANDAKVEQVFDPRAIQGAGLKRSDLPGFRSETPAFAPENAPTEAKKK